AHACVARRGGTGTPLPAARFQQQKIFEATPQFRTLGKFGQDQRAALLEAAPLTAQVAPPPGRHGTLEIALAMVAGFEQGAPVAAERFDCTATPGERGDKGRGERPLFVEELHE